MTDTDTPGTVPTTKHNDQGRWGRWLRRALAALGRALVVADFPRTPRTRQPRPGTWRVRLAPYGWTAAVLALIGLVASTAQYLLNNPDIDLNAGVAWFLAALTVAPLALLWHRPLWAWRVMLVSLFLGGFGGDDWPWSPTQIIVGLAVLATVAARADRDVLAVVGVVTLVPVWILVPAVGQAATTIVIVIILVLGESVRRIREVQGALAVQTEVSEREQAHRGQLEERTRIARELHDVVAHHMSMLAVRAETAPYRLQDVPDEAREEFTALAQSARDALADLRRLLGVLRSDAGPQLAPAPDLTAVANLVAGARDAGLDVHYLPPDPDALHRPPAPVALAGFRIIQEALANATRYAPDTRVTVQVWPGSRELAVRIHNSPSATAPQPSSGGHGITGMRERAGLLGGDFTAGRTAEGGFSVTATLPYDGDTQAGDDDDRTDP